MKAGEKAFVLFYGAYMLAYIPCFFLFMPSRLREILPFHFFGMALGIAVLVVVFRDLYKRDFPHPNTKLTWAILILTFSPSIIVYLYKHGFRPRTCLDTGLHSANAPQPLGESTPDGAGGGVGERAR